MYQRVVATQRQCHSALDVTLSWFCALQFEEQLDSDLETPLQGGSFAEFRVKNLDWFYISEPYDFSHRGN